MTTLANNLAVPHWKEPKNLGEARTRILSLGRSLHEYAYLVGKELQWVKGQVAHGEFENWIGKNLWFSERTARNFMAFAARCDAHGSLLEYHGQPKTELNSDLRSPVLPAGKYRCIVIDPPWPIEKTQRYVRPLDLQLDYPTMTSRSGRFPSPIWPIRKAATSICGRRIVSFPMLSSFSSNGESSTNAFLPG